MHSKNRHKNGYKFAVLLKSTPEIAQYVIKNKYNNQDTIDFSNPLAVKALNLSLLRSEYNIEYWDIPEGYLCPAIPGRVDYIHNLNDLLASSLKKQKTEKAINVLDIGTGASCIYPILGQSEYAWNFVASDVDPMSIKVANEIIASNKLDKKIQCRLQTNSDSIFNGVIKKGEYFHLTLCNPPFHKSLSEATKGTVQKWKNLSGPKNLAKNQNKTLNFGGQKAELWCPGGELAFIKKMIKESKEFKEQVLWFTCLISKKEHVNKIKFFLKKANISQVKIIKMEQGNKMSRFVAWSYT